MSRVKIAVIGAGHLGKIHTRLIQQLEGFELVAVVDPVEKARQAIANEYQVATLPEIKSLEGVIEAAVVATPTSAHLETTLWCLERGIHRLVEKPLVRSARHADILIQVARHRNLTLQVGHVERFNPAWQAWRPLANQVSYVSAHRTSSYSGRSTDIGVVFDLMIHDLDLILDCIDSPLISVHASGQAILGAHEDWAEARLQFQNGAIANLYASRVCRQSVRKMNLIGQAGSAEIDFAQGTCDIIEACEEVIQGNFAADQLPDDERKALSTTLFQRWLPHRPLNTQPTNAIERELIDFCESIQRQRQPLVSGRIARNAIEVAERVLEALRQSTENQQQAREANEFPSIIPAAHRFGVRRAS